MYIPGHISVAYLVATFGARRQGRPPAVFAETLPLMVGALTPDLIDKSLYLLEITAHSRTIGHSLFFASLLVILWLFQRRLRLPWARFFGFWLLGLLTHYVADLVNDILRGLLESGKLLDSWFLWPLLTPDDWRWTYEKPLFPDQYVYIIPECLIIVLAVWAVWSNAKKRR